MLCVVSLAKLAAEMFRHVLTETSEIADHEDCEKAQDLIHCAANLRLWAQFLIKWSMLQRF